MADKNTDKQDEKLAKQNFKVLCDMLDENNWKYDKNESEFQIDCLARGTHMSIGIHFKLNTNLKTVTLYSYMNFEVGEARKKNLAVAVARANTNIIAGNFDFKYETGRIIFRLASSYDNCVLSKDAFEYILFVSCNTVDNYGKKFTAVSQNDMTIAEVIKTVE